MRTWVAAALACMIACDASTGGRVEHDAARRRAPIVVDAARPVAVDAPAEAEVASTVPQLGPAEIDRLIGRKRGALGKLFAGVELTGALARHPRATTAAIAAYEREHDANVTFGLSEAYVEEVSITIPAAPARVRERVEARWGPPDLDVGEGAYWLAPATHTQVMVKRFGSYGDCELRFQHYLQIQDLVDGHGALVSPAKMLGMSLEALRRKVERAAPEAFAYDVSDDDTLVWQIPPLMFADRPWMVVVSVERGRVTDMKLNGKAREEDFQQLRALLTRRFGASREEPGALEYWEKGDVGVAVDADGESMAVYVMRP